ncbi:MAG: ComEC/Rec2 family competence protein [bacterium]
MSDERFADYEKNKSESSEEESLAGWGIIFGLFVVAAGLWFYAIPAYVHLWLRGSQPTARGEYEIPGDGTIPGRRPGEMAVVFLDVGYGDGILIQAPDNTTSLIDGGEGNNPVEEEVEAYDWAYELYLPLFDRLGITHLNNMINLVPVSHHMGVQPDLVAHELVEVEESYLTGYPASFVNYQQLEIEARNADVPVKELKEGQQIDFGPAIKSEVIYGQADNPAPAEASHVIYLKYGEVSLLLPGDLPVDFEKEMVVEWGENLQADVLKVGNHGHRDSTSMELLEFVNPSQAVISLGEQNPIFAPAEEVLKRLSRAGVSRTSIYRTDKQGHIIMYTDGRKVRFRTGAFPFL